MQAHPKVANKVLAADEHEPSHEKNGRFGFGEFAEKDVDRYGYVQIQLKTKQHERFAQCFVHPNDAVRSSNYFELNHVLGRQHQQAHHDGK